MANEEHLKILKQGVEVWNQWRKGNLQLKPDLSGIDLCKANFSGVFLYEVKLSEAKLTETNLMGADLRWANLNGADLSKADLNGANLFGANLRNANLTKANCIEINLDKADLTRAVIRETILNQADLRDAVLIEADFTGSELNMADLDGAHFRGTEFSKVNIGWTRFGNVDLSGIKGLGVVKHTGPSTLGIDTLYHSKDKIPEIFLRGTGLPDTLINYIASLTAQAIQYYSCFISYSSKDEAFTQRLHADLQQKGVRCWFAPEDMKIGDKIRPRIDESIRIHDKLLLILSENSLNSFWVESEVEKAFEEERKRNQTVLFPVRLDAAVMETDEAWAADIRRTRHIGDFSRWKDHDTYQQAFERLLRDLKAEG